MLSAPYLHQDRDDKLIWMLDSRGGYTVKSCSAAVAGFLLPCQTMNIPNHHGIITPVENVCCCCQTEEESLHHQLQQCQQVWRIWNHACVQLARINLDPS
uniref:Reverse transcriptase zinc-binding domain-containing protein n=1 Tax=Populus trichocarpa TaxID=3694 RepID=A0A3N7G666_POPTR